MFDQSFLQVIALNPSTADETLDDPTVRRCINYAKSWGFGALCMTNLFAWRDTHPANLPFVEEPVGPDNDRWLAECAAGAGMVLAAWGKGGAHRGRAGQVVKLIPRLYKLALNGDGSPGHPLYLRRDLAPTLL